MADGEIINAPNGLRKAKIGNGPARLDPELLARAEQVVEKIQAEYTDWADEDIAAFDAVLAELRSEGSDQSAVLRKIYQLSLDMKGQGGSFGYIMMSEVAASLNDFIARRTTLSRLGIEVVDAHISALHAIYGQQVRGDGGKVGRQVLAGLEKLVAKADARDEMD